MNLLHDIPAGDPNKHINVVTEIPIGSTTKFEYHDDVKTIVADRFLYTAFSYPFNYGFIPRSWSEDEDAMDVVVISSNPIPTGVLVECRLVGELATEDEEGPDAKLIALPKAKVDPQFAQYNELNELPEATLNKIKHFYENYKSIEPGKWVKVTGFLDRSQAIKDLEQAISRYQKHFSK